MRRVVTTVLYIDNSLCKGSKTDWHAPNAICYGAITSGDFPRLWDAIFELEQFLCTTPTEVMSKTGISAQTTSPLLVT